MAKTSRDGQYQAAGAWIRTSTRIAIYARDGYRCGCCGELVATEDLTLDHVISRSRGGSNGPENVYTCCRSCNCSRQDRSLRSFAGALVARRVARLCALPLDRAAARRELAARRAA